MIKQPQYRFLIQQYKNKIYTYSMYMLKNKMDAEDATQEVMIRIWKNIDKFNFLAAKTWIMKTTHNVCIDFLRKRSIDTKREILIDNDFEDTFSRNSDSENPLLITHGNIIAAKIKEAIQNLPDSYRNIFVMYEIQGFRYKEIGESLNIPVNTVKVYLLRARIKLQEVLKNYER